MKNKKNWRNKKQRIALWSSHTPNNMFIGIELRQLFIHRVPMPDASRRRCCQQMKTFNLFSQLKFPGRFRHPRFVGTRWDNPSRENQILLLKFNSTRSLSCCVAKLTPVWTIEWEWIDQNHEYSLRMRIAYVRIGWWRAVNDKYTAYAMKKRNSSLASTACRHTSKWQKTRNGKNIH